MTTDNSDLLGGAEPTSAPVTETQVSTKRRGRPPGSGKKAAVVPASTTPPAAPEGNTETAEQAPGAVEQEAPAAAASTQAPGEANAEAECSRDISDLLSVSEADGSVSVELPPVSPEYALAQANRVRIIGQTSRDYAYKRVLRAGKKL